MDESSAAEATDGYAESAIAQVLDLPDSDEKAATFANLALVAEIRALRLLEEGEASDEPADEAVQFEAQAKEPIMTPPRQSAGKGVAYSALAVMSEMRAYRLSKM